MTNLELKEKLEQAQRLLSDVYGWACDNDSTLEGLMSCADGCIRKALDALPEEKYMAVEIYRNDLRRSTNGVSSDRHEDTRFLVPCAFAGTAYETLAGQSVLHIMDFVHAADGVQAHFRPRSLPAKQWAMMGGNFAYTSDSRFADQYGSSPVPIHDRVEG